MNPDYALHIPFFLSYYNSSLFSAVFFEESKYQECIEECKKAIDIGRETQADYKLISK